MNIETIAIPSQELLEVAKSQAKKLSNNQQLRLTGSEHTHSYEVFRLNDKAYIGREIDSPCKPFFKNREVFNFKDGKYLYEIQRFSEK